MPDPEQSEADRIEKPIATLELIAEFKQGWNHFVSVLDLGRSALDAEAIRFMNEMPGRVVQQLINYAEAQTKGSM